MIGFITKVFSLNGWCMPKWLAQYVALHASSR